MDNFGRTIMGHQFFEGTIPKIAKALERIADNLDKMEQPENANRWIPETEAMPKPYTTVLLSCNGIIFMAQYRNNDWELLQEDGGWIEQSRQRGKVIAWMELPEPYED